MTSSAEYRTERAANRADQATVFPSSQHIARLRALKVQRLARVILTMVVCTALSFSILTIAEYNGPSYAATNFKPIVSAPTADASKQPDTAVAKIANRPLVEIATTESADSANALVGRTSIDAAWILLGIGLSAILALNAMLIDHLRRRYARSTRRHLDPLV